MSSNFQVFISEN